MSSTPNSDAVIPETPIDRIVGPFARFMHVQTASGVVLLVATVVALVMANSPWSETYLGIWKTKVGFQVGSVEFVHSLKHWINDCLMVLFFFVIGLEVKRELVIGELRDVRKAALPVAAALGGMVFPAAIYLALAFGGETQRGWGIPMATDIAFVVGCMAILGSRVPASLRVMLLSLAIADDIGAILVIALGYSSGLDFGALAIGLIGVGVVTLSARLVVRHFAIYVVLGVVIWVAFHQSGIHATIAGVILGLMTPARNYIQPQLFGSMLETAREVLEGGEWESATHRGERVRRFQWAARETISPLEYLESAMHPWVAFAIMPLFALANAGIPIEVSQLGSTTALAVMLGLVVGKPLGILVFAWLAVKLGLAQPPDFGWKLVAAGGALAGIGFTMALFVSELALEEPLLTTAKVGVLAGSFIAAVIGMVALVAMSSEPAASPSEPVDSPPRSA